MIICSPVPTTQPPFAVSPVVYRVSCSGTDTNGNLASKVHIYDVFFETGVGGASWQSPQDGTGTSTFTAIVPPYDFNGDGKPDLLWQNTATGELTVWYMGGAQGNNFLGFNVLAASVPGWSVVAVADFNGDGHPDLVWQNNSTGEVTVWYMGGAQGNSFLGYNILSAGEPGWSVVGAADFNGDGNPDLIWQNTTTGEATVWYMGGLQGNVFLGFNLLSSPVPGWSIVGHY